MKIWLQQSLWLCGSPQTVENSERWEYQTTWPASWEISMQVKKQQLEPDTGAMDWFQSGKGVWQGCILSPWATELRLRQALVMDRETWHAAVHRHKESDATEQVNWTEWTDLNAKKICIFVILCFQNCLRMCFSFPLVDNLAYNEIKSFFFRTFNVWHFYNLFSRESKLVSHLFWLFHTDNRSLSS